jgi:hypothetical protein
VGRPRKRAPCPDRVLERKRDLNSDVSGRHRVDGAVGQAVQAVVPAGRRGDARDLRAA